MTQLRPQNRDIAMVFQDYALYPQMTVEKNMGFALRNQGMKRAVIDQRVRGATQASGIGFLVLAPIAPTAPATPPASPSAPAKAKP